jgi:hypothetical protein
VEEGEGDSLDDSGCNNGFIWKENGKLSWVM